MKIKRRIPALLLATIMLLTCLTGCGKTNVDIELITDGTLSENGGGSSTDLQDGSAVKGRYVEEVTDLSDRLCGHGNRLYKLSDGRLVITDTYKPFLISDDNGVTWKEDNREWRTRMLDEETYIMDIAIGADNTAAVIYNDDSSDGEEDEYSINPRLLVIKPDGTENLIDIPMTGDDKYPTNVGIADNGRIFVSMLGSSNLYEVKEDGSCEFFMTVQGDSPELMQFQGNLMFLDGYGYKHPLIYDMEKKEYVGDEALANFVSENYPEGNSYTGSESYQMYFFAGEEGVLYIAGKKGLHRHVIGGSAMEQLIDGSLCTFNNPTYEISGMIMLAGNEFMTIFSGGRLVRYVYDSDVTAVPGDRLNIYSLKENDTIRQAIAQYQTVYPDIAVEYEIGMAEGSSVTREDALKSLNTKIMAGEGPDVLILDDMPLDSYIEKGLLMDLSAILGGLSGEDEIFSNIVQAMKKGDEVYAMPCEIQIPIIMGEEKYISQIKDLKSLADMMEELRKDYVGKDLLNICTEKGIMRYFAMVCAPAWTTDSGELDREAIAQFLEQTERIYNAQMDGLPEKTIDNYKQTNEMWLREFGELKDDSIYLRTGSTVISYVGGFTQLAYVAVERAGAYNEMISANRVDGFEESKWTVMNGQSNNVFCTHTLLGINAASKNTGAAEDFIKLSLGREAQNNLFYGLAVNKAAFDDSFIIDESMLGENGEYSYFSLGNDEGINVEFVAYQSNENQIAELRKCVEAANTPYIEDTVLEYSVYDEGTRYMQRAQSLEETVNAIEKKMSIYMVE
ncbi:MAG: carbohydrate ABC transporter substrate-binding protein [Lachnospiraceae bacterium]|nr:carbohydrate ABC transporter substrate-binding protein [Lachnospiraceae bacterium]